MSPILTQAVADSKSLTDEAAAELLLKAQSGDEPARQALIEDCYSFIAHLTRTFGPNACYDGNDLFTVGAQSVEHSIQRYAHRAPGTYFRAYARKQIRYAMWQFVGRYKHPIRVPEALWKHRTATGERSFPAYTTWSLDLVPGNEERPLCETLVDPTAVDPSEGVAGKLNKAWLYGAMAAARLTAQERDLLNRLFGLNQEPEENRLLAAKAHGCSRQYIHTQVHKLLARLRLHLLEAERRGRLCLAA